MAGEGSGSFEEDADEGVREDVSILMGDDGLSCVWKGRDLVGLVVEDEVYNATDLRIGLGSGWEDVLAGKKRVGKLVFVGEGRPLAFLASPLALLKGEVELDEAGIPSSGRPKAPSSSITLPLSERNADQGLDNFAEPPTTAPALLLTTALFPPFLPIDACAFLVSLSSTVFRLVKAGRTKTS
jgi:hypothetical protein